MREVKGEKDIQETNFRKWSYRWLKKVLNLVSSVGSVFFLIIDPIHYVTQMSDLCPRGKQWTCRCGEGNVKIKVKLSLYLISWALRDEDLWRSGGIDLPFLTLEIDGGEWSAPHPCHFTPGETDLSTYRTGEWVGPRTGVEAIERKNFSCPCQESNPDSYGVQPTA
jgi:hypothetical protein